MVTYPSDWNERSIGDFVHVARGASPRPIEAFLTSGVYGVNWIKIGDAPRYGKYITQTAEKITQSGAARSVRVNAGDFILSNSMSFGRPYILSIDGCIHDGWLRLYDYQDSVDKEFLYYLLSSEDTKKQYATFAAGSGVQNLNKTVVKKVVVHLPSIPEQKRIARALSEMDDHIDNLTELIEKKKAIRDGALEDLVSGRTRLPSFVDSWKEAKLLDHVYLVQGLTYTPESVVPHGILVLRSSNIQDGFLSLTDNVYVNSRITEEQYVQEGDILVCVRNGSSALIGKSCVLPQMPNTTLGAFMSILRGDTTGFVSQAFKSEIIQEQVRGRSNATINQITKKDFKSITLKMPGKQEQKAIADVLTAMDDEIKALEDERNKMMQIREGAMDDLLTGRVRLKV